MHAAETHPDAIDRRVWDAHGDAWQTQGRLREGLGGGAADMPGIRLMASGLPHAQWNNGDVTQTEKVSWDDVRAWYAARAGGRGVPWGVRVPAGTAFGRGRLVFRKRCMALDTARFRLFSCADDLAIRVADPEDAATVSRIDAEAFETSTEQARPWIEPQLSAARFTVALAVHSDAPVGAATAIRTDGRAGPCVGIFGVGVIGTARGRGIGSAITSWLVARAFAAGATLVHLNPDSEAAARLYSRLGFEETAGLDVYTDL